MVGRKKIFTNRSTHSVHKRIKLLFNYIVLPKLINLYLCNPLDPAIGLFKKVLTFVFTKHLKLIAPGVFILLNLNDRTSFDCVQASCI